MTRHEYPAEECAARERDTQPKPAPARQAKRGKRVMVVPVVIAALGVTAIGSYVTGRRQAGPSAASPDEAPAQAEAAGTWYCSMHPQITSPKPGKCPICFMDLIPQKEDGGSELGPRQLRMSTNAMALADIQTTLVKRQVVTNEVRMVGKVDYDETRLVDSTAWIPGRLDRLYVDYTGVPVRKGDHLFHIYSPKLVVAQDELLLALRATQQSTERTRNDTLNNLRIAEDKLRLWGLLDEQIEEIKRQGRASDHITIYAPVGGIVIRKHCNEGAYVKEGTPVYTIADLSLVWVALDAYESDIAWLRYAQQVEFTTESYPGEVFKGRIAFIDPVLDEKTRTVKIRVNVPNEDQRLKPGMFVHAIARSRLSAGGRVLDAALAGQWICPMHPEIVKNGPDENVVARVTAFHPNGFPKVVEKRVPKCDICGMDLVPAEDLGVVAGDKMPELPLVIPATAPLRTGRRAVVYVKLPDRDKPTFEGREVLLGPRAGDYYIVRHGLEEGEEVVTAGNFKIDSALQIKAKPSMMSPDDAAWPPPGDPERAAIDVPGTFRTALDRLYQSYLAAGRALAADDLTRARTAVHSLLAAAEAVDAGPLGAEAQSRWKKVSDQIIFAAYETTDAEDRDAARAHFADLSKALLWLVQSFGHALPEPIYRIRCPMALDYRGAEWLQLGGAIANPYFGPARPGCGEQVASFESQAPLGVPDSFRRQLDGVYGAYLTLHEALADDRLSDAVAARQAMRNALDVVGPQGLGDREGRAWQQTRQKLADALDADLEQAGIDEVRKQFEAVSLSMLHLVETFGHVQNVPLVKAYCPMAFNSKGAAWLQAGEKIANPYFGHKMLRCGEIQRTFTAAAGASVMNRPVMEELR